VLGAVLGAGFKRTLVAQQEERFCGAGKRRGSRSDSEDAYGRNSDDAESESLERERAIARGIAPDEGGG
jgi:hypothetical protein